MNMLFKSFFRIQGNRLQLFAPWPLTDIKKYLPCNLSLVMSPSLSCQPCPCMLKRAGQTRSVLDNPEQTWSELNWPDLTCGRHAPLSAVSAPAFRLSPRRRDFFPVIWRHSPFLKIFRCFYFFTFYPFSSECACF